MKNLLTAAFVAVSGLAAFAASPETRLSTYQKEIQGRQSGVYEIDGDLYVQVRLPCKSVAQKNQMKLKAVLSANELLKKWAIDYAAPMRAKADNAPDGIKLAAAVADACNSAWRFDDWSVKFKGQEVSSHEKDFVLLCQIVSSDDVVPQIPPSFSKAVPQDVLFNVLPLFVKEMRKRDAAKLYGMCSAVDLMPNADATQKAKEEFAKANADLGKYLASSEFVEVLKERAKKIRGPRTAEKWEDVPQGPTEEVSNSIAVVTNAIAEIAVVTNVLTRAQTDEERNTTGFSMKGEVMETTRISDEEEIVETRTITTVTTVRKVRRKTTKEVSGNPLFEDAFISGGKNIGDASAQTEMGKKAVAAYFDNVTPMDEKTQTVADALCENPGDSQLWNLYGRCLLQRDEKLAALVCFRCAVKLDAANQYALTNLSSVYDALGYVELARGLAVIAYGIADSDWCRDVAKGVLLK